MTVSSESQIGSPSKSWRDVIVDETTRLVSIQTWRKPDGSNEKNVLDNLKSIKEIFDSKAAAFNEEVFKKGGKLRIQPFVWPQENEQESRKYWVFGYRAGTGDRKISLICHLDTVPPGNDEWKPFEARVETRVYKGVPSDFLIGRGAIDDKGPAVVAFEAFVRALFEVVNDPAALNGVTLEVLFDTSEETDMSTPHYFKANPKQMPSLGVVFDAYWTVRAEKGIERPVFTISPAAVPAAPLDRLSISGLETSPGSTNMIPVYARSDVQGPEDLLDSFAANVAAWYRACPFDDTDYCPADLQVSRYERKVTLTAQVAGAQHGSAPHQNRANGANPLVSLTNFLAYLVERGILANNVNGEMSRFIRWAFGTRAFGENHSDLLTRFDPVFKEGNGTTYAPTQLSYQSGAIQLSLDVRYAIGHHSRGWDGSEGTISDISVFESVFKELVKRYQNETGGASVTFTTRTASRGDTDDNLFFGPDIRSPRNANLFRVAMAYRAVMGENCPMHATGGATDAHGYLNLVTAGALFTTDLGPPVNYHGLEEGAPLVDLENSGNILLYLLRQETAKTQRAVPVQLRHHGDCCFR